MMHRNIDRPLVIAAWVALQLVCCAAIFAAAAFSIRAIGALSPSVMLWCIRHAGWSFVFCCVIALACALSADHLANRREGWPHGWRS